MLLANLQLLGTNHRLASLAKRQTWVRPLTHWLAHKPAAVREWVLVSTCNRLELYAVLQPGGSPTVLRDWWAATTGKPAYPNQTYTAHALQVAEHLWRVAVGLDSQLLGDAQILGQLKEAYQGALQHQQCGQVLHVLWQKTIRIAKQVRQRSGFTQQAPSLAGLARQQAQLAAGDLAQRRIAVAGLGALSQGLLRGLFQNQLTHGLLFNRTLSTAQTWLAQHDPSGTWQARPLTELPNLLDTCDVLFTATAAPHVILPPPSTTRNRPLWLFDLALPQDIDPSWAVQPQVGLWTLADLQPELDADLKDRQAAIPAIEAWLQAELAAWHKQQRLLKPIGQPSLRNELSTPCLP